MARAMGAASWDPFFEGSEISPKRRDSLAETFPRAEILPEICDVNAVGIADVSGDVGVKGQE
jgi:hypothetical protein